MTLHFGRHGAGCVFSAIRGGHEWPCTVCALTGYLVTHTLSNIESADKSCHVKIGDKTGPGLVFVG